MNSINPLLTLAVAIAFSQLSISTASAEQPDHAAALSDQLTKIELEQNAALGYAPHRVLVRFRKDTPPGLKQSARDGLATAAVHHLKIVPGLERLDIGMDVAQAVANLRRLPFVDYAEPDYVVQAVDIPDDVSFGQEWGLNNTGQTVNGSTGTAGADINMPEAWDSITGNGSSIIAVIDTGTQWNHPDLADNIWSNPGEIAGNGIDDDGNGYVDDTRGWDFYNDDNNPDDADGHGTHTAGTICAKGNNGEGVSGVLWNCKIMPLRFIGPNGGYTSDAVDAINYAVANGAKVSSNSWGSYSFSLSLYNAISNAAASGHIFVAAAGNEGYDNNGSMPFYPASFNPDNIIAVAATTNRDSLAGWSNYGSTTVDVGAPGVNIYSTYKGSGYKFLSGTSMATPHVAGLVALVQEQHSNWSYQQVINHIISTARPLAALQGKSVSGGIINAQAALSGSLPLPPPPEPTQDPPSAPTSLQASADSTGVVALSWNDSSANEAGFQLERQKQHKNGSRWISSTLLSTVGADVTATTDAPGSGTFRYRVQAYNDAGSSAWSSWVTVDVTASGGGGGGGSPKPCHGKKCR
jgi:serine protease